MSFQQLTTSDYSTINQTLTQMLHSGAYTSVTMTLYNDAAGQHIAADNEGLIQNRPISSFTHTEPHADVHGNAINGSVTFHFTDNSVVVCTDGINEYYYQVGGIPYVPRNFGQQA